jgi:hypothetical protein
VVLPTGWIRAHLLDFEELPRRQTEIDQVVLWRLKKLLPVLPSELRVSTFPSQSPDGTKRLLCMVGVERVLADLESAFAEVGVEPGMVTPRLFALAHGRAAGSEILMQQESGFLSLLLVVDGAPQLLRTKPQTAGTETSEGISRELRLASGFIRDELGVSDGVAVTISAESGDADQALRTWWSDQDWVRIEEEAAAMPFINQEEAEKLGWARIAPVLGLIEGAAQ